MNIRRTNTGITGSLAFGYGVDMFYDEKGRYVEYKDVTWRTDFDKIPEGETVLVKLKDGSIELSVYINNCWRTRGLFGNWNPESVMQWQPIVG